MITIKDLYAAVENKSAKVLTIDLANELQGRKIATLYFGYKGQDGFDEFVIGEVKPEIYGNGTEGRICVFTSEGRNTCIRAHEENHGAFTCSDSDRFVFFIEVGNIETSEPAAKAGLDKLVTNGYFESAEGNKFFNLWASYDAKLNIKTGQCWSISHPNYKAISLPEINQLLAEGLLIDHNYGK